MSTMASLTASATPGSVHMSLDGIGRGSISRRGSDSKPLSSKYGSKIPRNRPLPKSLSRHFEPSTTASIPSRYQTFFYATTENKGFSSQATRFTRSIDIGDIPGPGTYKIQKDSLESASTSFSKKGTGGFASKSKRFRREMHQKLGPGSYDPHLHSYKTDFNRAGVGSNFQQPIAVKTDRNEKFCSPAPNSYNLAEVHTGKNSLVSAEAAFKSKTKRDAIILQLANNPAPGQYNIQDKLLYQSTCPHQSVFNSKSQRKMFSTSPQGPGPADYSPFDSSNSNTEPKPLPYYHQKHYLCISAPAIPLPPLPPSPGPGHYETQDQMAIADDKKTLVSGAVFKSTTSRWMSTNTVNNTNPGPCTYDPVFPKKRSYLYNVERKWI